METKMKYAIGFGVLAAAAITSPERLTASGRRVLVSHDLIRHTYGLTDAAEIYERAGVDVRATLEQILPEWFKSSEPPRYKRTMSDVTTLLGLRRTRTTQRNMDDVRKLRG